MNATETSPARTDRIVVAGLPRSGTTYVGKILEQHPDIRMVLEPLNEEFGLRGVRGQFPHIPEGRAYEAGQDADLIDRMVSMNGSWRRLAMSRGNQRTTAEKAMKVLFGSRTSWRWRIDAAAEAVGRPLASTQCFKDPFATFALDYLAMRHGIRSVCMLRHPGAYYNSFATQPWLFGVDRLASAEELRSSFGQSISDELWDSARTEKLAFCAVLWKLMANYLDAHRDLDQILVVRHEDFAADIETGTKSICGHLGLEFVAEMQDYIEATSSGDSVKPEYLKVHSFVRNSSAVADYWRSAISDEDNERLMKAVGDDLHHFYEEW